MPAVRRVRSSVVGQAAGTAMANVVAGSLLFVLFRLIAEGFGEAAFGDYQLARAATTLLSPLLLLGAGVVIPREIARRDSNLNDLDVMAGGVAVTFPLAGLLLVLALVAPEAGSIVGASSSSLVLPTALFVVAVLAVSVVASVLRGQGRFLEYNLLLVGTTSFGPLLGFLLATSIGGLLLINAAVAGLSALAWSLAISHRKGFAVTKPGAKRAAMTIIRYGPPRVIGDFSYLGLLAMPTLVAGAQEDAAVAGAIGLTTSVIAVGISIAGPISDVALPWAARVLSSSFVQAVRRNMRLLTFAVGLVSFLGSIVLFATAPLVVDLVGGVGGSRAVVAIRSASLALPGFAIFVAVRSVIDAEDLRAINARNSILSQVSLLATLTTLNAVGVGIARFGIAMVASSVVLGVLTLVSARNRQLL